MPPRRLNRSKGETRGGAFEVVVDRPHLSGRPRKPKPSLILGVPPSAEPGYYEDGAFGCRIENVLVVKVGQHPQNRGAANRGSVMRNREGREAGQQNSLASRKSKQIPSAK